MSESMTVIDATEDREAPEADGPGAAGLLSEGLAEAGLPDLPAPEALLRRLRLWDRWVYGTARPFAPLSDVGAHVQDLVRRPAPDRLMVSHDGRGANGWALHVALSVGPFGVMLQLPVGGAMNDPEAERTRVARTFDALAALLAAPPPTRRIVVVDSFHAAAIGEEDASGVVMFQEAVRPLQTLVAARGLDHAAAPRPAAVIHG